jgi:hypothetical protein
MTSLSSTTKIFFLGAAEVPGFIFLQLYNNSFFLAANLTPSYQTPPLTQSNLKRF